MTGAAPRSGEAAARHGAESPPGKPAWLRVRPPAGAAYERLRGIVASARLNTVCLSAGCPNMGRCWSAGTATVMILGARCGRGCGFCGLPRGGVPPDPGEPERVAGAIRRMNLRHVVLTSVSRDDLPDGGSALWAETIRAVRRSCPRATIEALVPDFSGRRESWEEVFAARPDILAHNVETVPRLYPLARPRADFSRSLNLLESAGARLPTKSGLMLGLGETPEEVRQVLGRLRSAGVRMVTIGQYLRPGPGRLPVARYVPPEEFDDLAREVRLLGFEGVASGPLVRSSYRAEELAQRAGVRA